MKKKICPSCGHQNLSGSKVCQACKEKDINENLNMYLIF